MGLCAVNGSLASQLCPASTVGTALAVSNSSLSHRRLIRDADGSLRLAEKPVAFILGERIVGPFLQRVWSVSSFLVSCIQPIVAFDRFFTRSIRLLPEASAESLSEATLTAEELVDDMDHHLLISPGKTDCSTYIQGLVQEDRLEFSKNITLSLHCNKIAEYVNKINQFFYMQGLNYGLWKSGVQQNCEVLARANQSFRHELEAIKQEDKTSLFSLLSADQRQLVIQLPTPLFFNGTSTKGWSWKLNGKEKSLSGGDNSFNVCSIEEEGSVSLIRLREKVDALFQPFFLQPRPTFALFKSSFSSEAMEKLDRGFPALEELVSQEFSDLAQRTILTLNNKQRELQEQILSHLRLICREHEAKAVSDHGLRTKSSDGCQTWIVTKKGWFGIESVLFSLSIEEQMKRREVESSYPSVTIKASFALVALSVIGWVVSKFFARQPGIPEPQQEVQSEQVEPIVKDYQAASQTSPNSPRKEIREQLVRAFLHTDDKRLKNALKQVSPQTYAAIDMLFAVELQASDGKALGIDIPADLDHPVREHIYALNKSTIKEIKKILQGGDG